MCAVGLASILKEYMVQSCGCLWACLRFTLRAAGDSDNAAYLANVCVADHARRRGVGSALIHAARSQARQWGNTPEPCR